MAQKTHTIQIKRTLIDCNDLLPPGFQLDGKWFGIVPKLRDIKRSQMLKPNIVWTCTNKSPEQLITAGIYTSETMLALKHPLLLPQEVESAQKYTAKQ